MLAWQDIRIRYRRSMLGPFWITISMAITIYTMGFLYGHLFKMDLQVYFPFLATGLLTWSLISLLLMEAPSIFVESSDFIRQVKLPFTVYVMRVIMRNLIIFAHNTLALLPLFFFLHMPFGWSLLAIFLGLFIIALTALGYGMALGILNARFRDFNPIITSLVQVVFFLSPILWVPSSVPKRYYFAVAYNPFAQFVALIRQPVLGHFPSTHTFVVTILTMLIGLALAFFLLVRTRHRIVFWL